MKRISILLLLVLLSSAGNAKENNRLAEVESHVWHTLSSFITPETKVYDFQRSMEIAKDYYAAFLKEDEQNAWLEMHHSDAGDGVLVVTTWESSLACLLESGAASRCVVSLRANNHPLSCSIKAADYSSGARYFICDYTRGHGTGVLRTTTSVFLVEKHAHDLIYMGSFPDREYDSSYLESIGGYVTTEWLSKLDFEGNGTITHCANLYVSSDEIVVENAEEVCSTYRLDLVRKRLSLFEGQDVLNKTLVEVFTSKSEDLKREVIKTAEVGEWAFYESYGIEATEGGKCILSHPEVKLAFHAAGDSPFQPSVDYMRIYLEPETDFENDQTTMVKIDNSSSSYTFFSTINAMYGQVLLAEYNSNLFSELAAGAKAIFENASGQRMQLSLAGSMAPVQDFMNCAVGQK
jgi:hypothetical protein